MKIHGKLHRVTDLKKFTASYIETGGKPTVGFAPWGKARVHLVTDMPTGQFGHGFLPSMSFKTDADSQGEFRFDLGTSGVFAKFRGQILAYQISSMASPLPGMPPVPVFDPIYRSMIFKLGEVSESAQKAVQNLYVFPATTPTASGISQDQLDAEVSALRQKLKLDKLKATILSKRVSVHAEKQGGEVEFSAFVRGSTSTDLERVIEVKAGDIDIDLPGPDFIVGLCVDEDEIEAQIRKGLAGLSKKVSQQLLAELAKVAPGVTSEATVSVWRTRYVQTGTRSIKVPGAPTVSVPIFAVVPDAAFGVPKQLFSVQKARVRRDERRVAVPA